MEKSKLIHSMFLLFSLCVFNNIKSQESVYSKFNTYEFNNAIGIRAGETSGLTFKRKFHGSNSFEGIVSFWPHTIGFTGLYEKNLKTGVPGLNWYFGGGLHVNAGPTYRTYYWYNRGDRYIYYTERRANVAFGVDGIIGIEYKFKPIPLAISTDLKPFIETGTYGYHYVSIDPSIGVKFAF